MPVDFSSFYEANDNWGPTQAGFSIDGGKVTCPLLLDVETGQDVIDGVEVLLGKTNVTTPSGDGKVQRIPPPAHGQWPWCYVSAVNSIMGTGGYDKVASSAALEVPPLPFTTLYETYKYVVEFTPRTYPLLPDTSINTYTDTWYDEFDVAHTFDYVDEWNRYCDFEIKPAGESIKGQQGSLYFITTAGGAGSANGQMFPSAPRVFLPNQRLDIIWRQVPYRYVNSPNSFITDPEFYGRINQQPFPPAGGPLPLTGFPQFDPGELLYIGYDAKKYTPPVPELSPWAAGIFSTDKLCDVILHFLVTKRTSPDAPATGATSSFDFLTGNRNWIPNGWNLHNWLQGDRAFHFAMTRLLGLPFRPYWLSFPMHALFIDPDSGVGP